MRFRSVQLTVWLPLILVLTACGSGDITYVIVPTPPSSTITLALSPDPGATAIATALGWGSAIPGAEVSIIPVDSSAAPVVLESSATGEVRVADLKAGSYLARVKRMLNPDEVMSLPTPDVEGWATLTSFTLPSTTSTLSVSVQVSRRKSLLISEWLINTPVDPIIGTYHYAQYIKLYNNADTTVYLDGMRLGSGFNLSYDYPNFPCSAFTEVTGDPTSIWAALVEQFPGTGHSYPVAPGQSVLITQDAIDHRGIAEGAPDLSHADFEQEASQNVDNPAVPNMTSVGPSFPTYHGIIFSPLADVVFLSLPVAPGDLRQDQTFNGVKYDRYPVGKLLDVVTWRTNWKGSSYAACPQILSPSLDRAPARAFGSNNYAFEAQRSLYRIELRPGSQPLLQHTGNSFADFVPGIRSVP